VQNKGGDSAKDALMLVFQPQAIPPKPYLIPSLSALLFIPIHITTLQKWSFMV